MAKPFLRWAGSKQQLVRQLSRYWTGDKKRYVEPFVGSARLFFEIEPNSGVLADINSDLIAMYEIVQNRPHQLYQKLKQWQNTEQEYYEVRAMNTDKLDAVDKAARFIYLNRYCFNGLYRTNRAGHFNVPYGGGKSGNTPSESQLLEASTLLTRMTLKCGDFENTLKEVRTDDFVYLDPPFMASGKRIFSEYDPQSFGVDDLGRLRKMLERIHEVGATFLLSYADCAEGDELAQDFYSSTTSTRRNIAGFAKKRRDAKELLISNVPT